jgi:hypothetical protein
VPRPLDKFILGRDRQADTTNPPFPVERHGLHAAIDVCGDLGKPCEQTLVLLASGTKCSATRMKACSVLAKAGEEPAPCK